MAWTSLCDFSELIVDEGRYVEIDGFQLAVFLHNQEVFVMDNTCPHAGGNLAGGFIEDDCAVCPWHYWSFHLNNGQLKDLPGIVVHTYRTRIREHEGRRLVQADLPSPQKAM